MISARPAVRASAIPGILWVGLAAFCFAAVYWFLDLNELHALRLNLDNGIFLQTLAHVARDGSAFNWADGTSHWLTHDSWFLVVLVPFVKLYPYQETLIAGQLAVVAGASVVLYVFARTIGMNSVAALLLACAYLISPSVQGFAWSEFSESHFEPILIFALATAAARRSFWGTLLCAQLLMGVKEDMGLFLIWFGLAGAVWYDRRLGSAVAALAVINTLAFFGILASHGASVHAPPLHWLPVYPLQDAAFLIEILAPFAFAPLLLGWRVLLALPLLAELFWGTYSTGHMPLARAGVHYTEALIALMAIGGAVAIRARPKLARWSLICSAVMALFFNTTVLHFGRHLFTPQWAAYENARRLVPAQVPAIFTPDHLGEWAVAAGDLNARTWMYDGFDFHPPSSRTR